MMENLLDKLTTPFTKEIEYLKTMTADLPVAPYLNAFGHFLVGLSITLVARWFVGAITQKNISHHHSLLFRRMTFYIGFTLSLIFPLKASGIDVSAVLGAAGIFTAAVAFAAQTSISNFLSGVFLEAEKPFMIGDKVEVNKMTGEVLSIDLLSVKIRTDDNTLVRIPNESLLKSQFCNISRFPIRRFDIRFRVAFNEDLSKIKRILTETASKNPLCLVFPDPQFSINGFTDSGIAVQFSVWGTQVSYGQLQTTLQMDIQAAFIAQGVDLPSTYNVLGALQS